MTGIEWTPIIIALIAGGLLTFIKDALRGLRAWRKESTPEAREAAKDAATLTTIDQNLTIVAKARDELEADNTRLRTELAEKDARHAAELAYRDSREANLREEVIRLEGKVREILSELEGLKRRHTPRLDTDPGMRRIVRP